MTAKPHPEPPPTAEQLRAAFNAAEPYTVGIEDEVMLLDPSTSELVPRAQEVLELLSGDSRFKLELPASQLEIVTPSLRSVGDACSALLAGRRELATRAGHLVALAGAGAHPSSPGAGPLNELPRYAHTIREHGEIARRQLVCALQVHVAVGDAERALAVYNQARSYLPLLAALAANAPFYEGHDTGLASIRPKLCELLPRQGVPPALASWEEFAATLTWGARTGAFPDPGSWWWELRPHRRYGTLEFRVPDGQTTVAAAGAIAAVIQALVVWLAEDGDRLGAAPVQPAWRIAQDRWSACRHGLEGAMADVDGRGSVSTRTRLTELLDVLTPAAKRLDSAHWLREARQLVSYPGPAQQRRVAAEHGIEGVAPWLAERFLDEPPG